MDLESQISLKASGIWDEKEKINGASFVRLFQVLFLLKHKQTNK